MTFIAHVRIIKLTILDEERLAKRGQYDPLALNQCQVVKQIALQSMARLP